jgi:hypothetical protein
MRAVHYYPVVTDGQGRPSPGAMFIAIRRTCPSRRTVGKAGRFVPQAERSTHATGRRRARLLNMLETIPMSKSGWIIG